MQIVQHEDQGVVQRGQRGDEVAQGKQKTVAMRLWRQLGQGRLWSYQPGQFGDQIDHHLAVGAEAPVQPLTPPVDGVVVLGQDEADDGVERLAQARYGSVCESGS